MTNKRISIFQLTTFVFVLLSFLIVEPSFAFGRYYNLNVQNKKNQQKQQRAKLKAIFQETKKISLKNSHGLNKTLTKIMIKETRAYHTRLNGNLLSLNDQKEIKAPSLQNKKNNIKTKYQISKLDSFTTAELLLNQGLNPLVLNMANKNAIGGGVEWGSKAQEECLFRSSNYFLAMYPKGQSNPTKNPKRKYYYYPIPEFGSYYTPNVQVFRDSKNNYAFIKPFSIACIAMAGYDLGKPHKLEKRIKNGAGVDLVAFKKYTKLKIRHLLEVAMANGHDSLVLGAISCGAFRLPNDNKGITAKIVATAYREVLQEPKYQNRFRNITFAVLPQGKVGKINYQVFDNMVQQL